MTSSQTAGVRARYNPIYISARLLRRAMPEAIAQRWLSRRGISAGELYRQTSSKYLRAIVEGGLAGEFVPDADLTIMETGTGLYNPAAAPLMLSGASRLILLEPFIGPQPDYDRFRTRFHALLTSANEDAGYPLAKQAAQAPAIANEAGALPPGVELSTQLWEETGLPEASVDGIFSSSVLEHLRDADGVLKECGRIVKPGGFMVNIVDMRDHFFRYPFEMLKFSEAGWGKLTTGDGGSGFQNRWRLGRWLDCLSRHGFDTTVIPLQEDESLAEQVRPLLHEDFRNIPIEELRVLKAILVSRRVAQNG